VILQLKLERYLELLRLNRGCLQSDAAERESRAWNKCEHTNSLLNHDRTLAFPLLSEACLASSQNTRGQGKGSEIREKFWLKV
jgi:hypothetical protein